MKQRIKYKKGLLGIYSIPLVFFFVISILFNYYTFKNEYVNIPSLVISTPFNFILFYLIYLILFRFYTVDIYEDKFIFISFFGLIKHQVYFFDIRNWSEIILPKDLKLKIYSGRKQFTFYFDEYPQYDLLKNIVSKHTIDKSSEDKLNHNRIWEKILIFFLLIVVISFTLVFIFYKPSSVVNKNSLKELTGVIDTIYTNSIKSNNELHLKLFEYPDFKFIVFQQVYYKINLQTLPQINKYDTVKILIDNTDYFSKILKTQELTFSEKYINYDNKISIYGLKTNNIQILSLEDINEVLNNKLDKYITYAVLLSIIIPCIIFLVFLIKKYNSDNI